MSVDLPPATTPTSSVDEVTSMEVTDNENVAIDNSMLLCVDHYIKYRFNVSNCLVHRCCNIKWGSDEVSVVVKTDGQCLLCFPEICEKIVLDHSTEVLTKKLTNLKIQLIDGSNILKETSHLHDTPSQTCQMIQYQDLLVILKHFNYKVPESFERAITSLENEVINSFIFIASLYFSSQVSVWITLVLVITYLYLLC